MTNLNYIYRFSSYRAVNVFLSDYKINHLMMKVYGEKKSLSFPEICTKTDINPLKTIIDPSYIQEFSPYRVVNKQILGSLLLAD
jgi:hypothetical protein